MKNICNIINIFCKVGMVLKKENYFKSRKRRATLGIGPYTLQFSPSTLPLHYENFIINCNILIIKLEITGYCKFCLCIKYISNFRWHIKSVTNNMQVFMYSDTLLFVILLYNVRYFK
jgi:hypothetical protein